MPPENGLRALRHKGLRNCNGALTRARAPARILQHAPVTPVEAGADRVGNPNTEDVVAGILKQEPAGVDVVFECAGQQDALDQAVEMLKPGGKLMVIGIPREPRVSFCPDLIRRKEISIINVRRQNHCTQKAIELLAGGKADLDFMITHTFDFEQTAEAFDLVANYRDGVVKALIKVTA